MPREQSALLNLKVHTLTADRWPSLEELFGKHGACNGCWCMYWRIGSEYHKRSRELNKKDFHRIVKKGPPPGLLAFANKIPVGWCQITPRSILPWLEKDRRLKSIDDLPVWCISCFYIRRGFRNKGVTTALIEAAIKLAKAANAPSLEAYPTNGASSFTGYPSTFRKAGFKIVAKHDPKRPVMRLQLRKSQGK